MIPSFQGLPVFVEVFLKSGIALGAALCLNIVLRRKSADLRRLVLSTAIVALFVAAVMLPILPRWHAVTSVPAFVPASIDNGPELPPSENLPAPSNPHSTQSRQISYTWLLNYLPGPIPLIWFAGAALLLTRFTIGLRGLRRLRNVSDPVTDADLLAYPAAASTRRRISLLQNETIAAPVTWGIVRPVILLPANFEQLPTESRNAVLSHELAHIQAYDFFMRILSEIARALLWFQPLMWIARRQLRVEQELACDNRVLAEGGKPSTYAKLLMDWASPSNAGHLALGMAQESCLKRRLYALLDQDLRRDAVSRAGVLTTLFLGFATALPLAALSFTPKTVPVPSAVVPTVIAQLQPQQTSKSDASQTAPDSAPGLEFEVASVKPFAPNSSGGFPLRTEGGPGTSDPGRISYVNLTMKSLLMTAYGVGNYFISGPAWLDTERYVITATIRSGATKEQVNQMLQNLLKQRFQMTIHRETRDTPVYELVMVRKGPNFKEYVESPDGGTANGRGNFLGRGLPFGLPAQWVLDGVSHATAKKVTIAQLINFLSFELKRPVLDKTGLTGEYDYNLDFAPVLGTEVNDSTNSAPDFITAVREQLGMKLNAKKGPIEVMVIDHAEKTPTEN